MLASGVGARAESCRPGPRPVAIVLSGGTSLGAYQAGALARALEFFARDPQSHRVQMFAGASAGGINSVLGFHDHCATSVNSAWLKKFWTGPVADTLFSPPTTANSLLNREAFRDLETQFREEFASSTHRCDAVVSMAVTLTNPQRLSKNDATGSQAQFLNFNLRMTPGSPARFENFVNPFDTATSHLLEIPAADATPLLTDLARATSSIPVIFPAQKLRYCTLRRDDTRLIRESPPFACPKDSLREGSFIDGALLDTTPLAQAVRLLKRGLVRDCNGEGAKWLSAPRNERQSDLLPELLILNLDVRNREAQEKPSGSLASGVGQLLGDLLKSARDREIINVLESNPNLGRQILNLDSHFPRWSDEWNGFFGFFDADLRAFDFAVGYVDMELSLKAAPAQARDQSALVSCLRRYAERPVADCAGLSARESVLFRALVREDVEGNTRPSAPSRFFRRMDQLTTEGFAFRELDLSSSETALAPVRVRSRVDRAARRLSEHYPDDSSTILGAVSGYLFGTGDPFPVERVYHFNWGTTFEVGVSELVRLDYQNAHFWRWPWIAEVYSPAALGTAPGDLTGDAAFTLYSGLEWEKFWGSGIESLISLRLGYQVSSAADGERRCERGRIEYCEGPSFQPAIAAVFFGNLRLQAGAKMTYDPRVRELAAIGIFQGGLQF